MIGITKRLSKTFFDLTRGLLGLTTHLRLPNFLHLELSLVLLSVREVRRRLRLNSHRSLVSGRRGALLRLSASLSSTVASLRSHGRVLLQYLKMKHSCAWKHG